MIPILEVFAQPSPLPPFSWTSWSGDGTLRGGLLLLAGVYLLGVGPLRERFNLGPPAGWGKIALYLSGVLVLLSALEGPIHELSDNYLFSAHMVQHMMLVYAAPPLLLMGIPGWLLQPVLRLPGVMSLARILTKPLFALIAFNVVFAVYHIPLYYNAVQANHNLHIGSHLLFIALAVITWWPLLSPLRELPSLSYPLRLLYVFGQTFSGFIVGSFVTNSQNVLYPYYSAAPRVWGMSPLDDQKIGGLLMWIVGGTFLLCVFSVVFFAWARAEGVHDDVAQPLRPRWTPPPKPVTSPAGTVDPGEVAASASPAREPSAPTPAASAADLSLRHVVTSAPDRSRLN